MTTISYDLAPAGSCPQTAPTLGDIERNFRSLITQMRLFPGAALAVSFNGRIILDLQGGLADSQRGECVTPETLFPLFSGTKPFTAVALWQQVEQGRIALDDRVSDIWPAFGALGKERVLIEHLLSHRGGFPDTPPALPRSTWGNWQKATGAIAAMPLAYEPGATSAYHFVNQHWVCAELVRQLDGRDIVSYVRDEISMPLQLHDTYLLLPADLEPRLARLHATDGCDKRTLETVRALWEYPLHRMVVPGASGVSTARDMARFYAAIAAGGALDGVRILSAGTVDRMLSLVVDADHDLTLDVPVRRCYGFELGGLEDPRRQWPGRTSTERTFWHGGFGSSVCWGERDQGLAFAFLTNGVRRDAAGAIARRDLSDAVRSVMS
ncbi:MAG: serine hydrolase domain-containing protein [Thermomicrobiales bacterium]